MKYDAENRLFVLALLARRCCPILPPLRRICAGDLLALVSLECAIGRKIAEVPWGIYASSLFVERHGKPATPVDINRSALSRLGGDSGFARRVLDESAWAKSRSRSQMQHCSQRALGDQVRRWYRAFAGCIRSCRQRACPRAWSIAGLKLPNVSSCTPGYSQNSAGKRRI
jgi:hypothetical protein